MAQREFKRRTSVRKGSTGTKRKKKRVSSAGKRKGSLFSRLGDMIPGPEAIAKFIVLGSIWVMVLGGGVIAYYGYGLPEKVSQSLIG